MQGGLIVKSLNRVDPAGTINVAHHPAFVLPAGFETPADYLWHLAKHGLRQAYGIETPPPGPDQPENVIAARLRTEFEAVTQNGLTHAFLVVADLIRWSRSKDILVGPGRGALCGSLLAYVLGITQVDPVRFDLSLALPCSVGQIFCIEVCCGKRQHLIRYLRRKYGRDHLSLMLSVEGRAKTHAAAVAVSNVPVGDVAPVSVVKRRLPVAQFTRRALQARGVLILHLLEFQVLSDLQRCIRTLHEQSGIDISLPGVPLDDPDTFALLRRGETTGLVHFGRCETRNLLTELQPRTFDALVPLFKAAPPATMPRTHAVSYTLIAYWAAYLRAHFPQHTAHWDCHRHD
jgi:DNA polymerase-3 subunit alpha